MLEATVRANDELVFLIDHSERLLFVNEAAAMAFGRSASELVGHELAEVGLPIGHSQPFALARAEAIATREPVERASSFELDGRSQRFYVTLTPVFDAHLAFVALLCVLRPLDSEPKSASISDAAGAVHTLSESSLCGTLVFDNQGLIVGANQTVCEWLGYSQTELVGKRTEELVMPEARAAMAEECARMHHDRHWQGEWPMVGADGATRHLNWSVVEHTAPGQWFAALVNITEQRLAERRLRETEQAMRIAYESAPIMLGLADIVGDKIRVGLMNTATAEFFNVPVEELVGKTADHLPIREATNRLWLEKYREARDSRRPVSFVYEDASQDPPRFLSATVVLVSEFEDGFRCSFAAEDLTERRLHAQAAEEAQQTLEALMEYVPKGITIADLPDVRIRRVSRYGTELVEKPISEITGIGATLHPNTWNIYHPETGELATLEQLPLTRATIHGEIVMDEEWLIRRGDGSEITILCNAGPIFGKDGKRKGGIIAWRDITDRKKAVEELQRANQRLQDTLDSIADAYLILDHEWAIRDVNAAAEELLDRKRHDLVGMNLWETFPAAIGSRFQSEYERAIREDVSVHLEEFYAPLGLWFEVHAYPSQHGLALYFRDITKRKLAEEALRESDSFHRKFLETLPQLVWTCRPDGECDYLSPQWLNYTGVPEEQQLGSGWANALHPDDQERALKAWRAAADELAPYDIVYRIRRYDGEYRWFQTRGRPILDAQGRVLRWYGSCTDIHEREEALDEIQNLNERLKRAMVETHHRVKNNLQLVSALIDMQVMEHAESVPTPRVHALSLQVTALAGVHDLLTKEVRQGRNTEHVNLNAVLGRLQPLLEQMAGGRPILFEVPDLRISGKQATAVALIANELAMNAIKHGKGAIRLRFAIHEGTASLVVEDEGDGFPVTFNPAAGAGTGLSLVESLAAVDLRAQVTYGRSDVGGARIAVRFPFRLERETSD